MNRSDRKHQGIALVVVLLVSVVALSALVSTASLSALSSRRVTGDERHATTALLAAESALNTVLTRSRTDQYEYDDTAHASVQAWLEEVGLDSSTLPNGATVTLTALDESAGSVTLRAVGNAPNGAQRTIYQDFVLDLEEVDPSLFADAALLTKDVLHTNSKNSKLVGRGLNADDWLFEDRLLSDSRVGEYVIREDGKKYRVEVRHGDGAYDLFDMEDGTVSENVGPNTPVTLLPFALTETVDLVDAVTPTTLKVTNTDLYRVGTEIAVGSGVGTITEVRAGEVVVNWDGVIPSSDLLEGSPIRKIVPSAIAEGGCPDPDSSHYDEKLPQGCFEEDLGDLWANTFAGATKTQLRDIAVSEGSYYSGGDWPSSVSGMTWIDGAKTKGKNNALCGDGIVVLNTGSAIDEETDSINLTTSDCEFEGVLYVIGQLRLVGNLDNMAGAIVVEGPGQTTVQGTGDKSLYDPVAIRRALESLPPITVENGLLATIPNSVRFGR